MPTEPNAPDLLNEMLQSLEVEATADKMITNAEKAKAEQSEAYKDAERVVNGFEK